MTLLIKDALLNIPFKLHLFVSAFPGSVVFGKVQLLDGMCRFLEDDTFILDYQKLNEFSELLEILGRNIICQEGDSDDIEFETKKIEIGAQENITVVNSSLVRHINEEEKSKIDFDHFSYLHFVTAIKNVCMFIINPSREEFLLMRKFERIDNNLSIQDAIVEIAVPGPLERRNEYEQFHTEIFLTTNIPLLKFCRSLRKLIQ